MFWKFYFKIFLFNKIMKAVFLLCFGGTKVSDGDTKLCVGNIIGSVNNIILIGK